MARKLVHIPETAEQLGITVPTLRFWIANNYGPPCARLGKRVVFDQEQIDAWVDEQFEAAAEARKGADTDDIPDAGPAVKIQKVPRSKSKSGVLVGTSRKGA